MTSEHLSRGKRLDNGEWIEGYYLPAYYSSRYGRIAAIFYNDDVLCKTYRVPVDPSTVGQYSGFEDIHKKLIFEGDKIRMNGNDVDLAVVCYGDFGVLDMETESAVDHVRGWYYKPLSTDALSQCEPFCLPFQLNAMWIKESQIEVIGNIHDNPELMERQEVSNEKSDL